MALEAEAEVAKVWVCDGCSSWTDRAVTYPVLLSEWGWDEAVDDDGEYLYCPDCQ